jgi:hypothetical protein
MEAIAGFGAACWRGGGGGGLGGEVRAEGRGSELRWGGVGEGEVREAVGVGGAAAVTVHWRGVGGNARVLGRRQPPLPLARRRGPGSNGFELLGGCHVDPILPDGTCLRNERECDDFAWRGRFRLGLVRLS